MVTSGQTVFTYFGQ